MSYMLGIDGGGSNLRVAVVDESLQVIASASAGTANPSVIGREASAALIQNAIREAVAEAGISVPDPIEIKAVGIGVAGAANAHSRAWLIEVVRAVLPDALIVPSSDMEIALVAAHGERRGVLILAGTGSVAYGVNDYGESVQVGGWGYLLGDEGSGFWLVMETLRAATRWADGTQPDAEALSRRMLAQIGLNQPQDLLSWVYRQPPATREIAGHVQTVFDTAAEGDNFAQQIIERGADALAAMTRAVIRRLDLSTPSIGFSGGLLSSENPLSLALCQRLNLSQLPQQRHAPVIGAALLAMGHQR